MEQWPSRPHEGPAVNGDISVDSPRRGSCASDAHGLRDGLSGTEEPSRVCRGGYPKRSKRCTARVGDVRVVAMGH